MTDLPFRIIAHYERHALQWDADRQAGTWLEKPWHDRFIAALPAAADVLDIGCGSGRPVAEHLAAQGCRVTGIDSSPSLIALARERLPEHAFLVADMRTLALGRRFAGILAWDSFFHLGFDDQRTMFPVFAAHAEPGAVLLFNTGPHHGEAVGEYRGDPLYHASLAPEEYRARLADAGFEVVAHVAEDEAEAGGRTVWLCRGR